MRFDLDLALAVLTRTPATLDALLRDLPDDWTRSNEGPDTWSPLDVVGHLIDGEETDWLPRARLILSDAPPAERRFAPFDRFRHLNAGAARPLSERLERFAALRMANVAALRALELTPERLARTGEHPTFGTVTLAQLLATWVAHDLGHLAQIARVMARQYAVEVGPWAAYLPVLHPRTGPPPA